MNRTGRVIAAAVKNLFIAVISLVILVPVFMIFINSFKDKRQSSSMGMELPEAWHFENYLTVIDKGKLVQSFLNSIGYSVFAVVISVLLAALAAFVLSRNRTRFNRFLYYVMIMGIAMPINFVALMKVMQFLQIINTRTGLVLLYAAIQIPFSVFLIYAFVGSLPVELDEASILDGCNSLQLFGLVILPLLKPVIITVFILNFLNTWNEFVLPLYFMNDSRSWPITLSVYSFFGRYSSDWHLVCADIVLICIPVVAVYLLGQRYIISGMTAGAVKG